MVTRQLLRDMEEDRAQPWKTWEREHASYVPTAEEKEIFNRTEIIRNNVAG